MTRFRISSLSIALLLTFLLSPWTSPELYGDTEKKTILYLNSYHDGYQWSDTILDGIRKEIERSPYNIELQVEYMDAKKYHIGPVIDGLLALYKEKFIDEDFDVVLVSDDDALNFSLEYRAELFPDIPIVFCGVNDLDDKDLGSGNLTGVVEAFDLSGTLDIALKLHPQRRRMIVVGDTSTAGLAIKNQIEELLPEYHQNLEVSYWMQMSLEEVQQRVAALPDDVFLFFIPYYQEIGNRFYSAEEVMEAIYRHSRVPLYTAWEFLLDHGAVGGKMISGLEHGRQATLMALRILDGERADSIPVSLRPHGVYLFDFEVMEKLGIDQDLLPEGSVIINAPKAFYELPREWFWAIIVSCCLLMITVLFLGVNMMVRRQVERRMKEQLTFQETLIDSIPHLISWKDGSGRYVGANRNFASFFGLGEVGEVVNKTTSEVVPDTDYVDWSVKADTRVVSGDKSFRRVRRRIVTDDSQESWLEVNKVPLRDQHGKISGILTTAENITREQNLEKQLLQSQKMEAIGTLAGGIAHDFNNILTSIVNSTELAIGDVAPGSQTEQDLERVLKAARRGGRVVKQIIAFSRPPQEGFQATDCAAVISEVIQLMEVSLPSNIVIQSYISPGIEPIYADPTQIHQALMNLCTNGFHSLREMGGKLEIRLEEVSLDEEEADYMELQPGAFLGLTVADNGPGIAPEIIDKIFDPFFSSKDKAEGTGLGLSVVHGIVKGHGGGLRVRSEPGRETVFEIFLPKIIPVNLGVASEDSVKSSHAGRILFVEDDLDQLQTTPRLLETFGFEVEAVAESGQAVTLMAANPQRFDLLITDYDMPGLNGVELIEVIRKYAPDLPVLMVSGREEAAGAAAGLPGEVSVVIKPYDKSELQSKIQMILNKDMI